MFVKLTLFLYLFYFNSILNIDLHIKFPYIYNLYYNFKRYVDTDEETHI